MLLAVGTAGGLTWLAIGTLFREGISLATVAGVVWGFGTLGFFMLHQFPIFGGSVEAENLMSQGKAYYTQADAKTILSQGGFRKPISRPTLIKFILFFILSGGLALVGIFTNT